MFCRSPGDPILTTSDHREPRAWVGDVNGYLDFDSEEYTAGMVLVRDGKGPIDIISSLTSVDSDTLSFLTK